MAGAQGAGEQGQLPAALQAHEVSALALHKCTLMYKYDQSFILVEFPTNKSHKWISITG